MHKEDGQKSGESKRDEGVKILINSCIKKLDRIEMRVSGESCAARPWEGDRHAVSKFRRTVTMKIAVKKPRAAILQSCLRN